MTQHYAYSPRYPGLGVSTDTNRTCTSSILFFFLTRSAPGTHLDSKYEQRNAVHVNFAQVGHAARYTLGFRLTPRGLLVTRKECNSPPTSRAASLSPRATLHLNASTVHSLSPPCFLPLSLTSLCPRFANNKENAVKYSARPNSQETESSKTFRNFSSHVYRHCLLGVKNFQIRRFN